MSEKTMTSEQLLFAAYEGASTARVVLHEAWDAKMLAPEKAIQAVKQLRQALAAAQELEVRSRNR